MMNPSQKVEFFVTSIERTEAGLYLALSNNNAALVSLNFRQALKCHLMVALLKWRHALGLPEPHLRDYLKLARQAYVVVPQLDRVTPLYQALPVSLPVVVSSLLDGKPDGDLLKVVPSPMDPQIAHTPEALREWSVAHALHEPQASGTLLTALQSTPVAKREALAQETFELYLSVLASPSSAAIASAVNKADTLYKKRSRDAYFSGGVQYYGGGPDNHHVVDFILAAVLRRVGAICPSEHRWCGSEPTGISQ